MTAAARAAFWSRWILFWSAICWQQVRASVTLRSPRWRTAQTAAVAAVETVLAMAR
ncbi:hypothetical protein ACFVUH_08215 [Kitasatospora sp. NPDC058032]|uniref:hypothetical protein n=1 Tax=Kitasatospora sp. NPDC058032 TaxID=3346307 RepID=UPI0036DF3AFB